MVEMRAKYGGMRYTTVQTRFDGSTYAGKTSTLFFFVIIVYFLIDHWPPLSPLATAAVLGNLPGHRDVAEKLAELKARIGTLHGPDTDHSSFSRCGPWLISCFSLLCLAAVPLLERFNVELKELKEIVSQSLRGRIFTNKDGNRAHSFDSDAWVGVWPIGPAGLIVFFLPPPPNSRVQRCLKTAA